MPNHRIINTWKLIKDSKIDDSKDRWHRSNNNMVTAQTNKKENKQTNKKKKATEVDYATSKRVYV